MPRHAPYRLGTVTSGSLATDPTNAVGAYDETRAFTVAIPGLETIGFELARKEPDATERGTILLASAADGSAFPGATPSNEAWIEANMVDDGWRIIQLRWPTGWHNTDGSAQPHGPAAIAARIATVVKYVHTTYCGSVNNLILCGGSGGASQFAYCLSHYGLSSIVSTFIAMGGPVHSDIYSGCTLVSGFAYDGTQASQMDDCYEETATAGPCQNNQPNIAGSKWKYDSILSGSLGWCRTVYLWGTADTTPGPTHGEAIRSRQPASRSRAAYPLATSHNVLNDTIGRLAVENVSNYEPFVRQSNTGLLTGGANSVALTLGKATIAGNLLVVVHRAATAVANMSAPSGFSIANDGTDNAQASPATSGIKVYWKVAAGGEESGLSVTTVGSVAQNAAIFEVSSFDAGSWGVESVDIETDSGVAVTTFPTPIGATGTPTAKTWCVAVLGASGGTGVFSNWTNGFVEQYALSAQRVGIAVRSQHTLAPIDVNVTINSSTRIAGLLVCFTKE